MDSVDRATFFEVKRMIGDGEYEPSRKDAEFIDSIAAKTDIDLSPAQSDWLLDIWKRARGEE